MTDPNQREHGQLNRQCLICELLEENERLKEKLAAYDEIYLRGCECDLDDACRFVKERDDARRTICQSVQLSQIEWGDGEKPLNEIAKERGWGYLFDIEK